MSKNAQQLDRRGFLGAMGGVAALGGGLFLTNSGDAHARTAAEEALRRWGVMPLKQQQRVH